MPSLSDEELLALRALPEFQAALESVKKAKEDEEARQKAEWDAKHRHCPGTSNPKVTKKSVKCRLCGLKLNVGDYYNASVESLARNLRDEHWIHAGGGNPFHRTGLSGKAAAASDGDWYGSH